MDIISLPVEYDTSKIDGKFRLVAIATQRAKDLSYGAKPKIKTKWKKVASIAIEEAVSPDCTLEYLTGEEAVAAKEEANKFDYRKFLEESRRAAAAEELSPIEKDVKAYLHDRKTTDKETFDELFNDKKEESTDSTTE